MGLTRYLYLLLLCQNYCILIWFFLQETTHDIEMLDQNVLYYTEKKLSYVCLNVAAEKNLAKCTLLVKL